MLLAQQLTSFDTEDEARRHFESLLSPYYQLAPEVQLTHDSGKRLRIDYVGIPRHTCEVELRPEIIGFEIKRSQISNSSTFQPFIRSLQQAIDYRHSRITDTRARVYQGERLPFVLVFPDYAELRDMKHIQPRIPGVELNDLQSRFDWIFGCLRLAGRFNVGVIRQQRSWDGTNFVEFEVSDTAIWRSHRGIVNENAFGSGRKRGSQ